MRVNAEVEVGSVENVDIDVTGDKFDAGQRESADRR